MMEHTLNWYNGEILEGKLILAFGIFLIVSALLFYYLGNTAGAKALLIPLLVIGVFFSATGVNMMYSNSNKKVEAKQHYQENEQEFVQSEIKRVKSFQYLYPMSIAISLVCFLVALGLLFFVKNIHWQAIAMTLILFGTAFAVIDYFSKERADIYYQKINKFAFKIE